MFHSDKNNGYEKLDIRNHNRLVVLRMRRFPLERVFAVARQWQKRSLISDEVLLSMATSPALQNRACIISTDHAGFPECHG